jgi:hypothetical protein
MLTNSAGLLGVANKPVKEIDVIIGAEIRQLALQFAAQL